MSLNYRATKDWPYHISAGGVVVRDDKVLLLKREIEPTGKPGGYHLPKGTIEPGEAIEQAAKREIAEEAGVLAEPIAYIGAISRVYSQGDNTYDKTTHYFVCEYQGEAEAAMDNEHDTREWYDFDTAVQLLSQMPKGEEEIIRRAQDYLAKT